MARKKSKFEQGDVDALLDSMFDIARDDGINVFDGKEAERRIVGLPLPSLALRYLFQSTVYPLSRIIQLTGVPGCGKSTLLAEMFRWHRMFGGRGVLMEAEDKDIPDQRLAVLNYDEKAVLLHPCESLEDWQEGLTYFIKQYKRLMEGTKDKPGPGRIMPICLGVDSLMGKAARETQKNVMKQGSASRSFALEANLISIFMKCMPQMISDWPFSVAGINHYKPKLDPVTGRPTGSTAGGFAPKFQETFELLVQKVKNFQRAKFEGYTVSIKTNKNSLGAGPKTIYADVLWWTKIDEVTGEAKQHTIWNWEAASITTLLGMQKQAGLFNKLMEICDLHPDRKRAGWVWSRALGITSDNTLTFREAGKILESRQDLLVAMYPLLGIKERIPFQPGVDFSEQIEAADDINKIRELTHQHVAKLQESRFYDNQTCDETGSDEEEEPVSMEE